MRYDVLLSFIGEDIRRTFLSHLLHSFDRKGITSITSTASNPIDKEAIRWSLVAVLVISKNYTSLDLWVEEHARIIDRHEKVVPIFLRVDPVDVLRVVRLAQDSVNIDEPRGNSLEMVKNWLDGYITSQSGFNSSDWEDDSQLVEQITRFISDTVTQDSISDRWFPRSPWEFDRLSEREVRGNYTQLSRPRKDASSSPFLPSPSMRPIPSETSIEQPSYVASMSPILHRSNSSETFIEPSSDVAPMSPISHSSSSSGIIVELSFGSPSEFPDEDPRSPVSETIIEPPWWDPFLNAFAEHSTRVEGSSFPRQVMNHQIEEVLSMLQPEDSTEEVRTVGICGMEGIGKTTLAKCVYQEISSQFQHHFFISSFSQKGSSLQEILPSETLNTTTNFNGSSEVIKEMIGRKVLLVADSVSDIKQLKSLVKEVSLFGPGSRVIVITQDRSLLFHCGVKHIYDVGCPGYDEAVQLFSQFAFKQTNPVSGFERLSGRAVEVAGRIPLALKVLGSYLHGRGQDEWESTLCKLEKTHNNYTTEEVLKYIGADDSAHRTPTLVELE